MIRELKEGFLPWLTGQVLRPRPTLQDYDDLARQWIQERVLPRKHRTTQRFVGEAWREESQQLRPIPARIIAGLAGELLVTPVPVVVDLHQRSLGEQVQVRSLAEYEVAL